jgi:hypothetical protein
MIRDVATGRRDVVPCGKCNFCLQARRVDWSFRLCQELRDSSAAHFLTLTYEVEPEGGLVKRDLQLFLKRLRKLNSQGVRYYAVGEYGTRTFRAHYHAIMFNVDQMVIHQLEKLWSHGHVLCGTVTPASIHYVTKYHVNASGDATGRAPPFCCMSRKPGIGSRYLGTHTKWHRAGMRNFTQVNGVITRLPRFFKDKMFTKMEKKVMAEAAITGGDERFLDEVKRLLSMDYVDPTGYMDESAVYDHDAVKLKSNLLNKF